VTATPVLVLGGYAQGLAVVRALGRRGIPVFCVYSSKNEAARRSKYARSSYRSPDPVLDEADFIEYLLSLAALHPGAVVIPTTDETLTAVARAKSQLAERFLVACMDYQRLESVLDKRRTYEVAERNGIPAPKTFTPTSFDELRECGRVLKFPCVVKPTSTYPHFATFGRKMTKVNDASELALAWRAVAAAGIDAVVQEFIPGSETAGVNYNAYVDDGEPVAECTAQKIRLSPPEMGFPTVVVSKPLPEVVELGRQVLRAFDVQGFSCTEFKLDARDNQFKLMEVNARPNISGILSVECRLDFPYLTYTHLSCGTYSVNGDWEPGIYWINTLTDFRQAVHRPPRALREFMKPYRSDHVNAVLDWSDPAPFAADCVRAARMIFSGVRRKVGLRRSVK
jgi:D-aspartate ligase